MERLTGFFHSVIAACGLQVVVPEVPEERGPSVVEHPLDYAGGIVFVARVGLEHGALGIVGHGLGFAFVVGEIGGGAVDRVHRVVEVLEIAETLFAGVKIPHRIGGLDVIGGQHFFEAARWRDRGACSDLCREAVGATGSRRVRKPEIGRRVIVGAAHFHAAFAADRRDVFRGGRDNGIGPVEIPEHGEVGALENRGWRLVAAVEPREHAGMDAQPFKLGALRRHGDFLVGRFPIRPFHPVIAAGPAGEDQHALFVGEIEEGVRLDLSLQANGVEIQIAEILKLRSEALRRFALEHVGCPASAADQDTLAVDAEKQVALRIDLGCDFADAIARDRVVRQNTLDIEIKIDLMQRGGAHLMWPPQFRILDAQLGEFFGAEADRARFAGGERQVLLDVVAFEIGFHRGRYLPIARVMKFGFHREIGLSERGVCEMRAHQRRADFDRAALAQPDAAPEAHVLIGRRGIPVDPVDAEVFLGLRDGIDRERVGPVVREQRRDVEFVCAIRAGSFARVCDALAVKPDIRAVVDSAEIQPDVAAAGSVRRRGEFRAVPPGAAEGAVFGHRADGEHFARGIVHARQGPQIVAEVRIRIGLVSHKRRYDGRGHPRGVPAAGFETR